MMTPDHAPRPSAPSKMSPDATAPNDNVVDLLRELVGQGTHLADQQLKLIKAEMREATTDLKVAVGGMVGAAVVGIAGLGVLLMGLAYLLADAVEDLGLATLVTGVVTVVIAYILYRSAASKMKATHLAPDRTQRTMQRTTEAVRGDL
jgi:uncharacterized membrane-anchored protein